MILIDVCTDTTIRTRDALEPFLSAMSKSQQKCGTPELAGHGTVGLLVNGSHNMVPKTHNVEEPDRGTLQVGDSSSKTQEDIKIANVSQQENAFAKGNRTLNSGSDGRQTSANDVVQIPEQRVFVNSVKALAESTGSITEAGNDSDVLQRRDNGDFPGDGSESTQPSIGSVSKDTSTVGVSDLNVSNSFVEIHAENDSELLEQLANPPDSPATIDVTEITQSSQSGLKRPQDFETCLDLSRSDVPSETSTKMVREKNSLKVTPLTPSTSIVSHSGTPLSKSESPPCGGQESQLAKSTPTSIHEDVSRSRTSTATSQSTEYSSSTSIATEDLSVGDHVESDFVEVNLQGQPTASIDSTSSKLDAKPKKKGLSGFLAKNLFRKSAKVNNTDRVAVDDPSWRSLGQSPPSSPGRSPQEITQERQKKGHTHPPTSSNSWKSRKPGMRYASSTTALILENRPSHLPAKNPEEQQKHVQEYEEMVRGAKKKELQVHKKQLKELEVRLRHEDGVQLHLQTWQEEILPNWETMKNNKKTRDLWWQGVPPSVRGRVWMLAIGNELNITPELFEIFLLRAKDRIKYISDIDSDGDSEEAHAGSREDSVEVIKLDIARTFPHLCIFQKGGPYYDYLHSVLGAYACYRPDVGYVQGMSFIAAVFLLYLNPPQAFHCFANLLNKSCQLAFFRLDQQVMQSYFATYEEYFQEHMPKLYQHFQEQSLTPDMYIIDWMYTLFIKCMPLDVACVILDVFFRDGEEFLFRTALGILKHYQMVLLQLDFIHIAKFLSKLPSDLTSEDLFQSIGEIDMHNQKRFKEVLASHLAQALTTS